MQHRQRVQVGTRCCAAARCQVFGIGRRAVALHDRGKAREVLGGHRFFAGDLHPRSVQRQGIGFPNRGEAVMRIATRAHVRLGAHFEEADRGALLQHPPEVLGIKAQAGRRRQCLTRKRGLRCAGGFAVLQELGDAAAHTGVRLLQAARKKVRGATWVDAGRGAAAATRAVQGIISLSPGATVRMEANEVLHCHSPQPLESYAPVRPDGKADAVSMARRIVD